MNNKIYIIGPVGSGKTTLSRKLSVKYNIKVYELDKVVWDDDNGNVKRCDKEIDKLFNKIISNKKWIIEDVGRTIFNKGISEADIVYYIDLGKFVIYMRCILRWIRQKIGLEKYNYKPTIKSLIDMLKWAKSDLKNKNKKLDYIKNNSKNYCILNKRKVEDIVNE